jgi:hypothetical protein
MLGCSPDYCETSILELALRLRLTGAMMHRTPQHNLNILHAGLNTLYDVIIGILPILRGAAELQRGAGVTPASHSVQGRALPRRLRNRRTVPHLKDNGCHPALP